MTDREEESMSITRELREYVACWYHTRALVDVADRIDARFAGEMQAKQNAGGIAPSDGAGDVRRTCRDCSEWVRRVTVENPCGHTRDGWCLAGRQWKDGDSRTCFLDTRTLCYGAGGQA